MNRLFCSNRTEHKSRVTLNVNFICSLSRYAGMIRQWRPFGVSAGRGQLA
jgi:hypothetical protein